MQQFKKTRRLLTKNEFSQVFDQAVKITTPEFVVLYRKNTLEHARLGMAISKKVAAKAHDRNRLKRLLRESFRTRQLPPLDLVILGRRGVTTSNNSTITTNLVKLWNKLAVL